MSNYYADGYEIEFAGDSTIDSWWIVLSIGQSNDMQTLTLTDVEAENLIDELRQVITEGRARNEFDWQPMPLPERDRDLLKRLLKGIAETWGSDGDESEFPDWRDNEYARGQLELVIEMCRVITDEEFRDGTGAAGDIDAQRDRITHWIRKGAWR